MELRQIRLEIPVDYVALVTLAKPPVNALGPSIREEFVHIFDVLHERDDVRAIVLTADGNVFCAGADIKEKRAMDAAPGTYPAVNRMIREAFYCIIECRKPVIAAVNGPAIGAGMVMASLCDIVLASETAFFAMPEIDVGLAGGAGFLQRILPPQKLRRLLLTGDRISAEAMRDLGVVEEVLPRADLLPAALAMAGRIAAKSPVAVQMTKQSFGMVENLSLRDGYRLEQDMTVALSRTEDAREAQTAFLEKRKPRFAGR